jgi:hypothetical protein
MGLPKMMQNNTFRTSKYQNFQKMTHPNFQGCGSGFSIELDADPGFNPDLGIIQKRNFLFYFFLKLKLKTKLLIGKTIFHWFVSLLFRSSSNKNV